MIALSGSSQKTYPALVVINGDTVVAMTRAQAREVNEQYATVEYLNGQIERYRILADTLDARVHTWQKIAELRQEQYKSEQFKEVHFKAEIKKFTKRKNFWKVLFIVTFGELARQYINDL